MPEISPFSHDNTDFLAEIWKAILSEFAKKHKVQAHQFLPFFFLNIYAHMDKQFHINLNHQIVFGLEHVCSLYVMGSLLARLKVLKC